MPPQVAGGAAVDAERALARLRAGRAEARLLHRFAGALQDPSQDSATALSAELVGYLDLHGRAVLLRDANRLYLNGRLVRSGLASTDCWLGELAKQLGQAGVGAVVLSGAWSPQTARALVAGGVGGLAAAAASVAAPARALVLDPERARAFCAEPGGERAEQEPAERAVFHYALLASLADATQRAVHEGRSPDTLWSEVQRALRATIEHLETHVFEWRLLGMALMPPLPRLSSHLVNTTALSLAMGRLLGLEREALLSLGLAAFFHDIGTPTQPAPGTETAANVRAALRGRVLGSAGLRRLIVCGERRCCGVPPQPVAEPHPFSGVVSVAAAFDMLEHGAGGDPLGPAEALERLRGEHDPVFVDLVRDVLGRYPRGTFLRLANGAVAVSVDGGARRGHRPLIKRILDANGVPDAAGALVAVQDLNQIAGPVDGSMFPRAWKVVLGAGQPSAPTPEEEDLLGVLPTPNKPEAELDLDGVMALREALESLPRALGALRAHPLDHEVARKAVDDALGALSGLLEGRIELSLGVGRTGISLGTTLVLPTTGLPTDLAFLLYPLGVRSVAFTPGLQRAELREFLALLASYQEDPEPSDLVGGLWPLNLQRIRCEVHDPLDPSLLTQLRDPILLPIGEAITKLLTVAQVGDAECERFFAAVGEAEEGGGEDPGAWGAIPEWVPIFLTSDQGAPRGALVAQLDRGVQADLLRASQLVGWVATQPGPPPPAQLARFRACAVATALEAGDLALACDQLTGAGGADGRVGAEASRRIGSAAVLARLTRRLEERSLDPEAIGAALELLGRLSDVAVPGVCAYYGSLLGKEELRRVYATFLVERIQVATDSLAPLTRSRDPHIAREALILLGQAGAKGAEMLQAFARDKRAGPRAEIAQEVLDSVSGAGGQRLLDTLANGKDKAQRMDAAVRLRKVGASAFEPLVALTRRRDFASRDPDEVEVVLQTIAQVGGSRAARVLEELAGAGSRKFSVSAIAKGGTRRLSRVAGGVLKGLKAQKKREGTRRLVKGACPRCRFENVPNAKKCLQCGTLLGAGAPPARAKSDPTAQTVRMNKADLMARKPVSEMPTQRIPRVKRPSTDRIKPAVDLSQVVAWLSYPLMEPVPLGVKDVSAVGRDKGSDLVLVHESVSRTHAIVRCAGTELVLEDRSSYGTWVNGERVMTYKLKPGDVITIGPYDIKVEAAQTKADPNAETKPLRTFATSEAIGGRLERVSLPEVLQQIEFNEKTGTLEVFADDGTQGLLVVYDGRPVYAEMQELKDDAAVLHMLSLKKGNFSFRTKIEPGEMTMQGTLTGILMEAARAVDEGE